MKIRSDYLLTEFVFIFPSVLAPKIEPHMRGLHVIRTCTEINKYKPHDLVAVYHIGLNYENMPIFVEFMKVLTEEQTKLCDADYNCYIGDREHNGLFVNGRPF